MFEYNARRVGRRTLLAALIGAAAVVVAVGADAQVGGEVAAAPESAAPVRLIPTLQEMGEVMKGLGYTVTVSDTAVRAKSDTLPYVAVMIDGDVVLLISWWGVRAGVDRVQLLEKCNTCNTSAMRGRYWVDKDGDVAVDRALEIAGGVLRADLEAAVTRGNTEMLSLLIRHMQDLLK